MRTTTMRPTAEAPGRLPSDRRGGGPDGRSAEAHAHLSYRPAVDGLRAVAVIAVIVFHGMAAWLPGGWLGVDVFFVISGYLITSLLLKERGGRGRIDFVGFWLARARRLLPALFVMLVAVLATAMFWTLPVRRAAVAGDVLATMFYVANWRMLFSDEGYFASLAAPSPLRHTWSLAVEEQYYLLFPLLLVLLLRYTTRRTQLAGALAALAGVSALIMANSYTPGVDPARVYYGTDARAFELLVGAVASVLVFRWSGPTARISLELDHWARRLGVPAFLVLLSSFWWATRATTFLFRGGLLLLCILAAVVVLSAAGVRRSRLQQALAWEPLRLIGLVSYGLYLWHWPVMVYLTSLRVGFGGVGLFGLQVGVTVALAYLSYRFVERPIRQHGVRALIPTAPNLGRPLAIGATVLILGGALLLPSTSVYFGIEKAGGNLTYAVPEYTPGDVPRRVFLIGNSIPEALAQRYPRGNFPDITVGNSTNVGCDLLDAAKMLNGTPEPQTADCAKWKATWPRDIATDKPDVVAVFVSQAMVADRQIDGRVVSFDSVQYKDYLFDTYNKIRQASQDGGAPGFALVGVSCHRVPDFGVSDEIRRINDDSYVERLNQMSAEWAASAGVPFIDQFGFLCAGGYHSTINDTPLYSDTLHFTDESAAIVWSWLVPQLREIASKATG